MTVTATIDQLRPGSEYPDGNINARLTYTDAEIEELAASLKGPDGQLRPFLVATHPKKPKLFFVFGGGRRRIAYERLIERGDLPKTHPIDIKDHGHITVAEALSKSFADNQHVPMHPADQAATFAKLAADKSPEDIAKERGMTVRAVNQSIALGTSLAPEVIAGWREGKLTREAVEAFTVADLETQTEVAKELADDDWEFRLNDLRRRLMRDKEPEMKRLLGFVGVEAFRANGGEVIEDFFGQGGNVKDMKPLKKMARAKMASVAEQLQADGWSWVETRLNRNHMHHGMSETKTVSILTDEERARLKEIDARLKVLRQDMHQWEEFEPGSEGERIEDEQEKIEQRAQLRGYSAKQKSGAGVIVELNDDGSLYYKPGLIRREEPKAKAKLGSSTAPAREPQAPKIPDIDANAEEHIQIIKKEVLGELIAERPKEAFAMFISALAHCDWNDAINHNDIASEADRDTIPGKSFADGFSILRKLSLEKLAAKFAVLVGRVTDIHGYLSGNKDAQAIVDLIGEKNLQAGLAAAFDPKIYVAGASKQHMLGIIAECGGEETRKLHENTGEAGLRLPAITAIKAEGWLPPALRTRVYQGPTAKSATVTKLKPKAKPAKATPKKKAA